MTHFSWLDVAQFVVMSLAGAMLWSLRQAFASGRFLARFEDYERQLRGMESRIDKASAHMSELAGVVQGLPDRLRHEFFLRREADLIHAESQRDREALRRDVEAIRVHLERRP